MTAACPICGEDPRALCSRCRERGVSGQLRLVRVPPHHVARRRLRIAIYVASGFALGLASALGALLGVAAAVGAW